ncbi:chemotaxis protein CheA [Puniceicoccaceae bacterium K14]|nr:chemotaxis protein CheA [Puniceicoccaceae bacterium K14]
MTWSSEEITKFEDLISQLSAEAHRAKPGSDEGLIPIYSLIGDIADTFKQDDALNQAVQTALATLQALLDTASDFDDASIQSMIAFAKWCENALEKMTSGQEIETYSEQPVATSEPKEPEAPATFEFSVPEPDADLSSIEIIDDAENDGLAVNTVDFDEVSEPEPETASIEEPQFEAAPIQDLAPAIDETPKLWQAEEVTKFEKLSQQFSAETLLAEVGTDNGMLPVYSLLKDFQTEFANKDILQNGVEIVLAQMDSLLDACKPYDDQTIALLTEFNLWLESARGDIRQDRDPQPFESTEITYEESEGTEIDLGDDNDEDQALLKEFAEFDVVMDLNMAENRELLEEFYSEAVDHLGQIESAVLELEQDVTSRDAINSMFRSFHTIKGVAGFLNLIPINRLAHEVESLMDLVRNDKLVVFTGIIDLVLEAKDVIGKLIEQISEALVQGTEPTTPLLVSKLMARARWAMKGPEEYAKITGDSQAAHIENSSKEETPKESAAPEATEGTTDQGSSPIDAPAQEAAPTPQAKAKVNENASIRVNTWKLDNLMDMVGELVIVQSQLLESSKSTESKGDSNFQSNMSQLTRITKDLQHTSMALRMIPIKATFQKMGRIVRDIGAKAGKKANFRVVGEDTELDRNVVEEIGDPLVHMVRNALDHGLESPEDRVAIGKPEAGNISLKAYHQGSSIVIELKDDGRGIDPEKVLKKAIANGIVREDEQLSDEEIFKLIFAAGFSTAEQITDISGRGVGMDVVKKNIEKLRGKIEIESVLGKGSTFKILLPLTMAIVDGLVVKVGEDRFILPTTSVKVALRPDENVIGKVQGNEEILNIRGKVIPLFRLHNHFQIPDAVTDTKDSTVVIVETAGKPCGLMVDDMVSKQEVVIKSLGSMMQGIPGVSGGAILGDGTIALILDPATLISAA